MGWLLVAVGGALGSLARYAVALALPRVGHASFPWATLAVNVSGCAVAGAFAAWVVARDPARALEWKAFFAVGLLGGFTTFSAFGIETLQLLQAGETQLALANVAGNLVAGLAAALLGFAALRALLG